MYAGSDPRRATHPRQPACLQGSIKKHQLNWYMCTSLHPYGIYLENNIKTLSSVPVVPRLTYKTFLFIYPMPLEDKSPSDLDKILTKEGSKDLRSSQESALSHIPLGCRSTQGELSEMRPL